MNIQDGTPHASGISMFSALLVFAGIWLVMSFVFVAALCLAASKGVRQHADVAEMKPAAEPRSTAFTGAVPSLTH